MGEVESWEAGLYVNGTLVPDSSDPYDIGLPLGGGARAPDAEAREAAQAAASADSERAAWAARARLLSLLPRPARARAPPPPPERAAARAAGSDAPSPTPSPSPSAAYFSGDPCAGNSTQCAWRNTDCLAYFLLLLEPEGGRGGGRRLAARVGALPRQVRPPAALNGSGSGAFPHAGSGILGALPTAWCRLRNGTAVIAPWFEPRPAGAAAADGELMDTLRLLNGVAAPFLDLQLPCGRLLRQGAAAAGASASGASAACASSGAAHSAPSPSPSPPALPYDAALERWLCPAYLLPDGVVSFHAASDLRAAAPDGAGALRARLALSLQVNDAGVVGYHRPSNFSRLGLLAPLRGGGGGGDGPPALGAEPARMALLELLWRGFARSGGLEEAEAAAGGGGGGGGGGGLPALGALGTFPFRASGDASALVEALLGALAPLALSLSLPAGLAAAVAEREARLEELQRAGGAPAGPAAAAAAALSLGLFAGGAAIFVGLGRGLRFALLGGSSPALLAGVLCGWGLCLAAQAALLGACLSSRRAASLAGYLLALGGTLCAMLIAAGVYGGGSILAAAAGAGGGGGGAPMPTMPAALLALPQLAFARFWLLATMACLAKRQCLQLQDAAAPGELRNILLALYLDAAASFLLALYLGQVFPRKYGVQRVRGGGRCLGAPLCAPLLLATRAPRPSVRAAPGATPLPPTPPPRSTPFSACCRRRRRPPPQPRARSRPATGARRAGAGASGTPARAPRPSPPPPPPRRRRRRCASPPPASRARAPPPPPPCRRPPPRRS